MGIMLYSYKLVCRLCSTNSFVFFWLCYLAILPFKKSFFCAEVSVPVMDTVDIIAFNKILCKNNNNNNTKWSRQSFTLPCQIFPIFGA